MLKAYAFEGIYFDQAAADKCMNALHGCGFAQGTDRLTTQTIRAQREFYRRVRQVFLDNGKGPALIGHNSNMMVPANYTHLDVLYNGEQFSERLPNDDYIDAIDEDMLHVQWSSKLLGIPVVFLSEIFSRESRESHWSDEDLYFKHLRTDHALKATRKLMALLLPNDMLFGGDRIHLDLGKRIWDIWDTLGDATYYSHR